MGVALAFAAAAPATGSGSSWLPLGPPQGGTIWALAVDPQSSRVFAATDRSGVYTSNDGGESWVSASRGLPGPNPGLGLSAPRTEILQAAAGVVYAFVRDALFKSTDGGASWTVTGLSGPLLALAIAPSAPSSLYAVLAGPQLLRSDDAGATWRGVGGLDALRLTLADSLAVDPGDPNRVYASTEDGRLLASSDGGYHWNVAATLAAGNFRHQLLVDPANVGVLYLEGGDKLLRSGDRGVHWQRIDAALAHDGSVVALAALARPEPQLYAAVVRSGEASSGAGAADGLLYGSSDQGTTWRRLGQARSVTALAVEPARTRRIYVGTSGFGVLSNDNAGAKWSQGSGLLDHAIVDVVCSPVVAETLYLLTGGGPGRGPAEFQKSVDGGISWTSPTHRGVVFGAAEVHRVLPDPRVADTLYVVARVGAEPGAAGLYKSVDGGTSWQPGNLPPGVSVEDLGIDPQSPSNLLAVGWTVEESCSGSDCFEYRHFQAFRSNDGGTTWTAFADELLGPSERGAFTAVRLDPQHPRNVYLVGDQSFRSSDGGTSWTPLAPDAPVQDLVIDPSQPNVLYIAASGLFKSVDFGQTWQALDGPPAAIQHLSVDRLRRATLYAAAAEQGVWISTDGGGHWAEMSDGLPGLAVQALAADPFRPAHVIAATLGYGGIYVFTPQP